MSIEITDTGNTIKWSDSVKDKDVVFNKNEVLITLKTEGVDIFEIEDSHYRETFKYSEVTVPTSTDSDDLLDQLQAFVTGSNPVIELSSDAVVDMNIIVEAFLTWNNQITTNPTFFTHVSGSSEITIVETGAYSLSHKVSGNSGGPGDKNVSILPKVNDTSYFLLAGSGFVSDGSSNPLSTGSCPPSPPISLTAGDIIELTTGRSGDAGTVNTLAGEYWFKIEKIS